MSVQASISPSYRRWNLGLVTLALLGFGLYCVYDATLAYPKQIEIYEARLATIEAFPDTYPAEWAKLAAANDWPEKPKERTETDILTQWVMAALTLPFAFIYGFYYIRSYSRNVAMDEQGLSANKSNPIPWPEIKSVDDTRWKTKGIAQVHYHDDQGNEQELTLDDWKFETEPTRVIHKAVLAYIQGRDETDEQERDPEEHQLITHAYTTGRQQQAQSA